MGEQNGVLIGERRLAPVQPLEVRMLQRNIQGPQPVGPLRMARRGKVFQEDRVLVKTCAHETKSIDEI